MEGVEQSPPVVLCKDCKHSFRTISDIIFSSGAYSYKCRQNYSSDKVELNLVIGDDKRSGRYETCSYSRLNSQPCGEIGRLWQAKDPKKFMFMTIQHEAALGKK